MATNGGTVRDAAARRRRIAEKGAERLALITGRVQSISSSPLPPSAPQSHHSSTAPSPPSISRDPDQLPLSGMYLFEQYISVSPILLSDFLMKNEIEDDNSIVSVSPRL